MTISNNDLKKTICIVCYDKFGNHSKNGWMQCLFRLQGTIAMNDINGTPDNSGIKPIGCGNPSDGN